MKELRNHVEANIVDETPTERISLADKVLARLADIMGHDPFVSDSADDPDSDEEESAGEYYSRTSLSRSRGNDLVASLGTDASTLAEHDSSSTQLLLHAKTIKVCAGQKRNTIVKAAELCEDLLS
jgi:hypothetical protein